MNKRPNLRPEQDPRAVAEAQAYAMLLTYKHGQDFPAFADIAERLRVEHRRLEEIDDQRQVAASFGFVMDMTMNHLEMNGYKVDKTKRKKRDK
jgi:hypothetical protein